MIEAVQPMTIEEYSRGRYYLAEIRGMTRLLLRPHGRSEGRVNRATDYLGTDGNGIYWYIEGYSYITRAQAAQAVHNAE